MRPTLLNTPFVQARDVEKYLSNALLFLLKNQYVIVPKDKVDAIGSQRIFSSTPVNRIFKSVATAGKLNNFLFLDYSSLTNTSIPEVLVSDDLCIDGNAITAFQVPAVAQKCWINITPIVGKKDAYNDNINITDTSVLAQLVTRAALCQAYKDKDMWLTIKQALYVIEVYATIVTQTISNMYNLNPDERKFIMTLFAIYYAQLCGPENADPKVPPMIMRCPWLGSGSDILAVVEDIQSVIPKEDKGMLKLSTIVEIIRKKGPSRMKNYTVQMLYRSLSASSLDSSIMVIAMDYPPYFVYQLLRVASGYKNPIISGIVKTLGIKNKLMGFADDVADNPNLVGALTR